MMKNLWIIGVGIWCLSCNTQYNYIDSGLAQGYFPGSMWEYLHTNSYDWDSTIVLIERAGLEDLFEGHREGYDSITFFGPTNLSIIRWMCNEGYHSLDEIPPEECEELILRHVVKGVHWRDDIPRGQKVEGKVQGEGGIVFKAAAENSMWVYSFRESYANIPDKGPVVLYIISLDRMKEINVASTNIETETGIVHSLDYSYTLGEL